MSIVSAPTHEVVETLAFTRQRDKLAIPDEDYDDILDVYAKNPRYGEVIKDTGGLRKGRVKKSDTGKSGGYRVFSVFFNMSRPVYLLWVINKTKDENITDEQKKAFKSLISLIKKELDGGR